MSQPLRLVVKPNLDPKCAHYPFLCMPNVKAIDYVFEFYGNFCKCEKRKEKVFKRLLSIIM